MSERIIDLIDSYKNDGYDYGKIREYLKNSGFKDEEITLAFNDHDNLEIHRLYLTQKLKQGKAAFYSSLVLIPFSIYFDIIQYRASGELFMEWAFIALTLSVSSFLYLKSIKSKFYSTSRILRENRKLKN